MNTRQAEWRDIPGYEGKYRISSDGRIYIVRSRQEKKIVVHHSGFLSVTFRTREGKAVGHQVHRLVAAAFLGMKPKDRVRFKDGDKLNCAMDNLVVIPRKAKPPKLSLEERFWQNVGIDDSDRCWLWHGSKNNAGYGSIGFRKKSIMAHRLSWRLHFGNIPAGQVVMHKCDNPGCVNPDHLQLGTYRDNARDAIDKGRFEPGWYSRKFASEEQKKVIESMARSLGMKRTQLVSEMLTYALENMFDQP